MCLSGFNVCWQSVKCYYSGRKQSKCVINSSNIFLRVELHRIHHASPLQSSDYVDFSFRWSLEWRKSWNLGDCSLPGDRYDPLWLQNLPYKCNDEIVLGYPERTRSSVYTGIYEKCTTRGSFLSTNISFHRLYAWVIECPNIYLWYMQEWDIVLDLYWILRCASLDSTWEIDLYVLVTWLIANSNDVILDVVIVVVVLQSQLFSMMNMYRKWLLVCRLAKENI